MRLLQSAPDGHSPLTGQQLAEKRVKQWYCMGGQYPSGKEANFYRPDPLSTYFTLQNWHKPVIFCGWEIGNKILTGGKRVKEALTEQHPVYQAYLHYNNFASRPSWDQLAVYLLSNDSASYIERIGSGYCEVNEAGENHWVEGKKKGFKHSYIRLKNESDAERLAEEIDALIIGNGK